MLHSEIGKDPVSVELPRGKSLWGDALFFRGKSECEEAELLRKQLDERPYAATGTGEEGDLTFLRPGEWVFAPFKEALIAAVTRWDQIGIKTRWYEWRADQSAVPSYDDFVRDHQEREALFQSNRMTLFEARDHVLYTPATLTGYWLLENLPNGMSMADWFGPKYRHFIKRDATVWEAKCIMQEATFDYWRALSPKGLKLLHGRRGTWN
ncbi:hypothetical protein PRJ39_06075 [Lysobacter enzymogenes]|uniref:hypothetical protein n=1 Tax=Lysobacter enzymogenes TaxID=69 RepID=UPI003748FCE4